MSIRRKQSIEKLRQEREADLAEQRSRQLREREIAYAQQIERVRGAVQHATTPGDITGFEPKELAEITIEPSPLMHGDPGAGLSGSGFDARSVQRGQEGEANFAKALQKQGVLDRFATFWSVQMPDEIIGASKDFQTDIDCVLVTADRVGSSTSRITIREV